MIINFKTYNELLKLKLEDCGFIYGFKKLEKIYRVKNISNYENQFIMHPGQAVFFLIKNVFNFFKKDFRFAIYHVHDINGKISAEDKRFTISNINYIIVYKKMLIGYKKEDNQIKSIYIKAE